MHSQRRNMQRRKARVSVSRTCSQAAQAAEAAAQASQGGHAALPAAGPPLQRSQPSAKAAQPAAGEAHAAGARRSVGDALLCEGGVEAGNAATAQPSARPASQACDGRMARRRGHAAGRLSRKDSRSKLARGAQHYAAGQPFGPAALRTPQSLRPLLLPSSPFTPVNCCPGTPSRPACAWPRPSCCRFGARPPPPLSRCCTPRAAAWLFVAPGRPPKPGLQGGSELECV